MSRDDAYVTDDLTHFVGRGRSANEQYATLKSILQSGWLTHQPHNPQPSLSMKVILNRTFSGNEMLNPDMICFCDILPRHLRIHTEKYSAFGIAFSKRWLAVQGANPVMYVAKGSGIYVKKGERQVQGVPRESVSNEEFERRASEPQRIEDFELRSRGELFDKEMQTFWDIWYEEVQIQEGEDGSAKALAMCDLKSKVFLLTHLLGFIKVFDDTLPEDHADNYYMEREWRRLGNLHFEPENVTAVLVPEGMVEEAQEELPLYAERGSNRSALS